MRDYRPIAVAAARARTDESTLWDFKRAGWIETVEKNGSCFISSQDEYRCRVILHLREKMKLTDEEIGIVLKNGKPPYSVDQVPGILARYATVGKD
jgi:hypothetical protein